MRVALLIAGYLRTFKHNIENIQENIINKFPHVDIYIHITKDEILDDKYDNHIDIDEEIIFINKTLKPIVLLVEPNLDYTEIKKENVLYNQWGKFFKLNSLKNINEISFKKSYDLVIKYRPDLKFIDNSIFPPIFKKGLVYIPQDTKMDKTRLENISDPYLCDTFAYGDSKTMDNYFSLFNNLKELNEKYGYVPETLLYNHLNNNNILYSLEDIKYKILLSSCNIFAICGDSGSGKSTLGKILKTCFDNSFMLECDRYHKWERGDENWGTYTHLNPDANFLEKMSDDIFDLKVGKEIYHVDYDHKTGKFTEKQEINPSENIIVCGLHSLYTTQDNPYNLKIFIDTDNTLKSKWKIKRDVLERGHNIENVLAQIEKRKEDYVKYILPQRDKSDMIINFFTDQKLDLKKLDSKDNIKLRLLIDKKYNISKPLKGLKGLIDFKIKKNEQYHEIVIPKYIKIHTIPTTTNSYYDYILFFIFQMIQNG